MRSHTPRLFEVLLTASEAYPALEREFMLAEHEILASFRVFDPWTKLRSQAAKRVGQIWFDLLIDTLDRGVQITLTISDFDPVARMNFHIHSWNCVRAIYAAAELSKNPHLLKVTAAMHPASVGILPRLLLWPRMIKEINTSLEDINQKPPAARTDILNRAPYVRPLVRYHGQKLAARRFPPPRLYPVTHHQKLAVFDDSRLYIGGLDLDDRRYDTPNHDRKASETWHDTQIIVDGPVAREAADHLREFQRVVRGAKPTKTDFLLRTISARRAVDLPFMSPKPVVSEIATAHREMIGRSSSLIYLETQYLRDRTLAKQLARRAKEASGLTLIIILPAAPEEAAFGNEKSSDVAYGEHLQCQCVDIIRRAFGARVFIGSPVQQESAKSKGRASLYGSPIIYLHAKVSIFDGVDAIVSSGNLNGRSMCWDTEAGVTTTTPQEARHLQTRSFKHWLGDTADEALFQQETACSAWSKLAKRNAGLPPEKRQGFIVPYAEDPAELVGRNLPGVPEEIA
ncbi:phospholipase D-like domain-containing protein [Lentibacter sp. XHP0401]|uniref:phospholipase D-like domain-containing protein n=1 Tax=Lentibacter sp. XHP0401 TaxID=2984334 RepID=UPI0021E7CF22|nr:phospholipase D-like domain-containing protein [Lentibacter sp. XHP0401]MCV2892240.1 phospholipase D-like domain-containing protein [Lentibacter sp. XHP0401]